MNTALRNPFMLQEGTPFLLLLLQGDRWNERARDSQRPFISSGSFLVTRAVIFCLSASEEPSGPPSFVSFVLLLLRLILLLLLLLRLLFPFSPSCQTSLRPQDLGQITCIQLVEASTVAEGTSSSNEQFANRITTRRHPFDVLLRSFLPSRLSDIPAIPARCFARR